MVIAEPIMGMPDVTLTWCLECCVDNVNCKQYSLNRESATQADNTKQTTPFSVLVTRSTGLPNVGLELKHVCGPVGCQSLESLLCHAHLLAG